MSAGVLNRTLPLRRWLALALVISFVVPFGLTGFIAFHLIGDGTEEKINQAEDRLQADVAQWNDPTWQQAICRRSEKRWHRHSAGAEHQPNLRKHPEYSRHDG